MPGSVIIWKEAGIATSCTMHQIVGQEILMSQDTTLVLAVGLRFKFGERFSDAKSVRFVHWRPASGMCTSKEPVSHNHQCRLANELADPQLSISIFPLIESYGFLSIQIVHALNQVHVSHFVVRVTGHVIPNACTGWMNLHFLSSYVYSNTLTWRILYYVTFFLCRIPDLLSHFVTFLFTTLFKENANADYVYRCT